jgi:hypothetical protein
MTINTKTKDIQNFVDAVALLANAKPSSETTSAAAKKTAIDQFVRRSNFAQKHEKYVNEDLPNGAPVYVYCRHCGIMIDRLPEDYLFTPYSQCSQCAGLQSQGWLEEAKNKTKLLV